MAINFDSLPSSSPYSLPEKGPYYATIEKGEMKQGVDLTKPPYLNLVLSIQNAEGKNKGKIFDLQTESDNSIARYKLKRFIDALEIPITGTFELKDLAKIVPGKKFIVDITTEEKDGKPPRAVVDVFSGEIYYPLSEASRLFGGASEDDETPFIDEDDAADATTTSNTTEAEY